MNNYLQVSISYIILGFVVLAVILFFIHIYTKNKKTVNTKEDKEIETYEIDFTCENCDNEDDYDIPVGTTIKEFLRTKICEYCGCLLETEGDNSDESDEEQAEDVEDKK